MWPLELTATPATAPRWMSAGSLKKSGTDLKGMLGAVCEGIGTTSPAGGVCASAAGPTSSNRPAMNRFMQSLPPCVSYHSPPVSDVDKARRANCAAKIHTHAVQSRSQPGEQLIECYPW